MAVYTVHIPRSLSGERPSAERIVFLRDSFSWGAFLFGPLWLAWRRAWLPAVLWVVFLVVLGGAASALGLNRLGISILELAASVILGFEGARLVAWSLARRGYTESAVQVGDDLDEAEDIFFASWRPDAPVPLRSSSPSAGSGAPAPQVIAGLFEEPRQ